MPSTPDFRAAPWLESALSTGAGSLLLAGALEDNLGIDPVAMRVLGTYGLAYMVEVDGYYTDANGTRADLAAGDVVLITPELAHAYGPEPGTPWKHLYFVFSGPQFDLWQQSGLLDPSRPVWRALPVEFWTRRLEESVRPDEGHGAAAALRAFGRFLDVLAGLLAVRDSAKGEDAADAWLEESQRLLGAASDGGWLTPQAVARKVGLSYENFRKQFTARTGVSPGQFQKRKRIDRAQSAIYHGDRTLKQLAEELEFCDVFHFSKVFKQVAGITPSEFRKRVRGA